MNPGVVFITGSTDGIGRATAIELARRGWSVVLHGRDPAKIDRVAGEIEAAAGYVPRSYVADFGDLGAVAGMCRAVVEREARIDVLINNAGSGFGGLALTGDGHDRDMQVNFLAPFMLLWVLRHRVERAINICSDAQMPLRLPVDFGRQRRQGLAYARSKLALVAATRAFASDGLACVAVHPGSMVDTQMSRRLIDACPWFFRRQLRRRAAQAPALGEVATLLAGIACEAIGVQFDGGFRTPAGLDRPHRQVDDPIFRAKLHEAAIAAISPHLRSVGLTADLQQMGHRHAA